MSRFVLALQVAVCTVVSVARVEAQGQAPDLRLATLEELMNIEVTSASRREQRAEDVPAAVYVIGRDEIRRSGLTSIPELLRLAPGVQVAQVNANKWAVSVRGFNSLYSNKLLVLVDGRSIYNPAFSTVLWDTEDFLIEDIDRIEVIRGPGGAMWGANAVNGIINIITKPATATQGGFVQVGAGTLDTATAALRYGGSFGGLTYRLFAQGSNHGNGIPPAGAPVASDRWRSLTSGVRADWSHGANALMVQSSSTYGRQRPLWFNLDPAVIATGELGTSDISETDVAHVLGRWTHTRALGASLQVQAYYDQSHRDETIGIYDRSTWDLDAQYHVTLGSRHDLVAGGGYRHIDEVIEGRGGYSFTPNRVRPIIVNGFAQDTIGMAGSRVELTLGAKYENNTFAGSGFQPTTRLLWKVTSQQRLWASAARAIRIPSLIDRGLYVEYPPVLMPNGIPMTVGAIGNADFNSEHLFNAEVGYRLNLGSMVSIDAVGFSGRYDDLQTYEPVEPVLTPSPVFSAPAELKVLRRVQNVLSADTAGAELTGRLQLTRIWEIDGAFSAFHLTPHGNGSRDVNAIAYDGQAPRTQWRAHSSFPLGPRGQADLHLFHVGPIDGLQVAAYTRLDVRLEWPLTNQLSVIASGQNLTNHAHAEFSGHETNLQSTLVPRSAGLRLAWRF
jgi:iron complex outermembrane recepter protein